MTEKSLPRFALDILGKLANGAELRWDAEGGILGGRRVPPRMLDELKRRHLVESKSGYLVLTAPGRLYANRRSDPPKLARGERIARYRHQHLSLKREARDMPDGERSIALVNQAESPLGWLARRKDKEGKPLINQRQHNAGERLRVDFEMAALGQRVTASYDPLPIGRQRRAAPEIHASEIQMSSRTRVMAALDAVGGGLSDILLRTCCFLEGLEQAERALNWPARSGKLVLTIALDRLADHYEKPRGAKKAGRQ